MSVQINSRWSEDCCSNDDKSFPCELPCEHSSISPQHTTLSPNLTSADMYYEGYGIPQQYNRRNIKCERTKVTETKFLYYVLILIILVVCLEWICFSEPSIQLRSTSLLEDDRSSLYSEIYLNRIRTLLEDAMGQNVYKNTTNNSRPLCPAVPELLGQMRFEREFSENSSFCHNCSLTLADVSKRNPDILPGGSWRPRDCIARHQVAFIIPYRDREDNLINLLDTLIPTLKRQKIHFQIYLVEQNGTLTFNKGVLMNAGYIEALKDRQWHCFTFHDVDLIPADDRNMYTCPIQPRHMSVLIDTMEYTLPYEELVGGVFVLRTKHFQVANGYSNMYWGWGAEDDDMYYRVITSGFRVQRPPYRVSKYKMEAHSKRKSAPFKYRYNLLHNALRRFRTDGLNSVKYQVLSTKREPLFTHFLIDVGIPPH